MAVGVALATKMKGLNRVVVAFFGDGGFEEGVVHESLNFAALKNLPLIFVCENNVIILTPFRFVDRHWRRQSQQVRAEDNLNWQ